jgi:hypothetical protein
MQGFAWCPKRLLFRSDVGSAVWRERQRWKYATGDGSYSDIRFSWDRQDGRIHDLRGTEPTA